MADVSDFLLVAAIDLGTTFSGFAFSFRHEYMRDPLLISAHSWPAESGELISHKCSTCALFDPCQNFHSFGFKAEDKYEDLASENEHEDWYLFRRFKMTLYEAMELEREFSLNDITGKSMPALKVFSESLKYLKNEMFKAYHSKAPDVVESDIRWVVTVPAIWTDASKQFMREAAELAGIRREKLLLALEPEAASLYCKHLPVEKRGGVGYDAFKSGCKYITFDAGGGTVDITVHEVMDNKHVKEIYKANGGNWGGTVVDDNFCRLLSDIVGKECFECFKKTESYDYLELMRSFEIKKRLTKVEDSYKITVRIPTSLGELCMNQNRGKTVKDMIRFANYTNKCKLFGDKMKISSECTLVLFTDPVNRVIEHMQDLLLKPNVTDVKTVLMVGGFSECDVLISKMRETFPQFNIVIPNEAGLAVLKGAVLFGHDPTSIQVRICRFTYGVSTSRKFQYGVHDESKKYVGTIDNKDYCEQLFSKHVEIGQSVIVGQTLKAKSYSPTYENQESIRFNVYASTDQNPMYVTDGSCLKLGQIEVDVSGLSDDDKSVTVAMTFGKTELEVKAISEATGKEVKAYFTCLQ